MLTVRKFILFASFAVVTTAQAETMQSQLDALTQIEELRTEIQTLRGELEVTQYDLNQVKQQQRDYYDDLNQRITQLSKTPSAATATPMNTEVAQNIVGTKPAPAAYAGTSGAIEPEPNIPPAAIIDTTTAEAAIKNANGDLAAYQIAYGFLQSKKYPEAAAAFNTYLTTYPKGEYIANVNYWLGEIYLIQHKYPEAEHAFSVVVNQFASHPKAPDALLKLGYAYEAAGDKQKALATFQEVQQKYPNTTVARLAQSKASQI
jgi:tol-pal system protein YbgF